MVVDAPGKLGVVPIVLGAADIGSVPVVLGAAGRLAELPVVLGAAGRLAVVPVVLCRERHISCIQHVARVLCRAMPPKFDLYYIFLKNALLRSPNRTLTPSPFSL